MPAKDTSVVEETPIEAAEDSKETKRAKVKKTARPSKKPSKRYQSITKSIENRAYSLEEAISLVKKNATAKFDETIEAHFRLGIDPGQTSQQVRGSVQLPHGTGKKVRALVFASGPAVEEATKAGATVANEETTTQIEKGSIPFDLVLATPEAMPQIAKLARVLGVRGLMPNPKAGTITTDIAGTIKARNQGLVDFKNENSLVHVALGKASFTKEGLKDNFTALLQALRAAKPAKTSGEYIRSVTLTSTMGPGVSVDRESVK